MKVLDDLADDVRHAMRSLRHSPTFTAVALLTLALGIGANAAIFGVLKSLLLDALPYADPDRLVRVQARRLDTSFEPALSVGTIDAIAARQQSFSSLAAFQFGASDAVYGSADGARTTQIVWVEPGFFETLGVPVSEGRSFRLDDATNGLAPLSAGQVVPDTASSVVLSHGGWQRFFAGRGDVVGRTVLIDGVTRTIIGVLPRAFVGPVGDADFYLPFDRAPVLSNPPLAWRSYWLRLVGRLKPGVSVETASSELSAIAAQLASEHPEGNVGVDLEAVPLQEAMVGDMRAPLLLLMASAGFVLLIACANLAGALLSRTLSRRKELAMRVAMGAQRARLVRQALAESAVLALAGGAAGLMLAVFVLAALSALALPALPAHADPSLDLGAVIVTMLVSLGTGLVFGTLPALSAARVAPQAVLREETRSVGESRRSRWVRGMLVAGQVALCVSLLAGAGLLARSLWAMTTAPLGIDPAGVLTARMQLPARDYATAQDRARFLEQLMERVRGLPGVEAVASTSRLPTTEMGRLGFAIPDAPWPDDLEPAALATSVSDDYFRVLRIPLVSGRTFDGQDRPDGTPTIVISQSMARQYWPRGDALGARIRIGPNRDAPLREVIGIVGDVRNDRARRDAEAMIYLPSRGAQAPFASLVIRATGEPLALLPALQRELAALDPQIPLERTMTLRSVVSDALGSRQLPVMLITAFGSLSLLLASLSVYGMFVSMVSAREGEFAVRMALGSAPGAIARLVLRQGGLWMGIGLAVGAVGVWHVGRLLRDLIYGMSPLDPVALGLGTAILIACAAAAALVPVRRAARVAPASLLRAQ